MEIEIIDHKNDEDKNNTFFCDLCKLEYVTEQDFQEHTWSLLHHKKLDKEKGRKYVHKCSLCNDESVGLLAYTKHIHSEEHQKRLRERRVKNSKSENEDSSRQNHSEEPNYLAENQCSENSPQNPSPIWSSTPRPRFPNTNWNRPGYTPQNFNPRFWQLRPQKFPRYIHNFNQFNRPWRPREPYRFNQQNFNDFTPRNMPLQPQFLKNSPIGSLMDQPFRPPPSNNNQQVGRCVSPIDLPNRQCPSPNAQPNSRRFSPIDQPNRRSNSPIDQAKSRSNSPIDRANSLCFSPIEQPKSRSNSSMEQPINRSKSSRGRYFKRKFPKPCRRLPSSIEQSVKDSNPASKKSTGASDSFINQPIGLATSSSTIKQSTASKHQSMNQSRSITRSDSPINANNNNQNKSGDKANEILDDLGNFQGFKAVIAMREKMKGCSDRWAKSSGNNAKQHNINKRKATFEQPKDRKSPNNVNENVANAKKPRISEMKKPASPNSMLKKRSNKYIEYLASNKKKKDSHKPFTIVSTTTVDSDNISVSKTSTRSPNVKGNASSGNVNAGIALASQRPNPFVSDSEEESLASFVTEHLFTGPSGRTAAPGQSIDPDEAGSHESNVHDNTSKVNQLGKEQQNLPNLDPKQSLSFQRIPDRDLSTATQCSNTKTTDNRDTRKLLVGANRTGKQSRSHSSTVQTLSSNQSSVNSGKSVNTMAAPSVNISRSTAPALNAEAPSNSIEKAKGKTANLAKGESKEKVDSLGRSLMSLDESLMSTSQSQQCEFLYQNGRRCPSNSQKKFCAYHQKVLQVVHTHITKSASSSMCQSDSESPASINSTAISEISRIETPASKEKAPAASVATPNIQSSSASNQEVITASASSSNQRLDGTVSKSHNGRHSTDAVMSTEKLVSVTNENSIPIANKTSISQVKSGTVVSDHTEKNTAQNGISDSGIDGGSSTNAASNLDSATAVTSTSNSSFHIIESTFCNSDNTVARNNSRHLNHTSEIPTVTASAPTNVAAVPGLLESKIGKSVGNSEPSDSAASSTTSRQAKNVTNVTDAGKYCGKRPDELKCSESKETETGANKDSVQHVDKPEKLHTGNNQTMNASASTVAGGNKMNRQKQVLRDFFDNLKKSRAGTSKELSLKDSFKIITPVKKSTTDKISEKEADRNEEKTEKTEKEAKQTEKAVCTPEKKTCKAHLDSREISDKPGKAIADKASKANVPKTRTDGLKQVSAQGTSEKVEDGAETSSSKEVMEEKDEMARKDADPPKQSNFDSSTFQKEVQMLLQLENETKKKSSLLVKLRSRIKEKKSRIESLNAELANLTATESFTSIEVETNTHLAERLQESLVGHYGKEFKELLARERQGQTEVVKEQQSTTSLNDSGQHRSSNGATLNKPHNSEYREARPLSNTSDITKQMSTASKLDNISSQQSSSSSFDILKQRISSNSSAVNSSQLLEQNNYLKFSEVDTQCTSSTNSPNLDHLPDKPSSSSTSKFSKAELSSSKSDLTKQKHPRRTNASPGAKVTKKPRSSDSFSSRSSREVEKNNNEVDADKSNSDDTNSNKISKDLHKKSPTSSSHTETTVGYEISHASRSLAHENSLGEIESPEFSCRTVDRFHDMYSTQDVECSSSIDSSMDLESTLDSIDKRARNRQKITNSWLAREEGQRDTCSPASNDDKQSKYTAISRKSLDVCSPLDPIRLGSLCDDQSDTIKTLPGDEDWSSSRSSTDSMSTQNLDDNDEEVGSLSHLNALTSPYEPQPTEKLQKSTTRQSSVVQSPSNSKKTPHSKVSGSGRKSPLSAASPHDSQCLNTSHSLVPKIERLSPSKVSSSCHSPAKNSLEKKRCYQAFKKSLDLGSESDFTDTENSRGTIRKLKRRADMSGTGGKETLSVKKRKRSESGDTGMKKQSIVKHCGDQVESGAKCQVKNKGNRESVNEPKSKVTKVSERTRPNAPKDMEKNSSSELKDQRDRSTRGRVQTFEISSTTSAKVFKSSGSSRKNNSNGDKHNRSDLQSSEDRNKIVKSSTSSRRANGNGDKYTRNSAQSSEERHGIVKSRGSSRKSYSNGDKHYRKDAQSSEDRHSIVKSIGSSGRTNGNGDKHTRNGAQSSGDRNEIVKSSGSARKSKSRDGRERDTFR